MQRRLLPAYGICILFVIRLTVQPEKDRTVYNCGIWTEEENSLLEACVRIQGQSDRVSCLAAEGLGKPCNRVQNLFSPI